jgi:cyclophilin family peptidyl-prolyl cis-trans isomerase
MGNDVEMHPMQKQECYRDEAPSPPMDIMNIVEDLDEIDETGVFNNRIPRSNRRHLLSRVSIVVLAIIVLILAIVGISKSKANKITAAPLVTLSNDPTSLGGSIIEFTVANLNTNRDKCTHIQPSNRLECIPNHDESTNKFRIQLYPQWSPLGVQHFEELTRAKFWEDVRIFRVVPSFVSQFGLSSDPSTQRRWSEHINDDPVIGSNVRGTVTYATAGENTRTTQIFINTADNGFLDDQGFSPIGIVLDAGDGYGGMEVVDEFYDGYGEKPNQGLIESNGIDYLQDKFPLLSFIVAADFVN